MLDPDYDPYEMLEDLAAALKWHSEIVEGISKNNLTMNNNILALYKLLHETNLRLENIENRLNATEQATTNHRPRRQ